jgi:phosphate transport system protein
MESHTVHSYDEDLASISTSVVRMGRLVDDLLGLAGDALLASLGQKLDNPKDLTDIAIETDRKVNSFDHTIEADAMAMLALRQPMAIDLRRVVSALRIAVILERMGDLAKNTVRRTENVHTPLPVNSLQAIQSMFAIVKRMLEETLEAFTRKDLEMVTAVCVRDHEVDALYASLMQTLEAQMRQHPEAIAELLQVSFALKNIERFADYVTKFAKIVYYISTGERAPKWNREGHPE